MRINDDNIPGQTTRAEFDIDPQYTDGVLTGYALRVSHTINMTLEQHAAWMGELAQRVMKRHPALAAAAKMLDDISSAPVPTTTNPATTADPPPTLRIRPAIDAAGRAAQVLELVWYDDQGGCHRSAKYANNWAAATTGDPLIQKDICWAYGEAEKHKIANPILELTAAQAADLAEAQEYRTYLISHVGPMRPYASHHRSGILPTLYGLQVSVVGGPPTSSNWDAPANPSPVIKKNMIERMREIERASNETLPAPEYVTAAEARQMAGDASGAGLVPGAAPPEEFVLSITPTVGGKFSWHLGGPFGNPLPPIAGLTLQHVKDYCRMDLERIRRPEKYRDLRLDETATRVEILQRNPAGKWETVRTL